MHSSKLRALLGALPKSPSTDDLSPVAEALAQACGTRAQPRKSLVLYLRNVKNAAPAAVLGALSDLVIESLDRASCVASTTIPATSGAWIDVSEAARVFSLQRATLTERLKLPDYRHLYGWPHWDGHQWWFSSVALNPDTRIEFLARLPKREPDAHVAMLPPWCVRQRAAPEATESGPHAV